MTDVSGGGTVDARLTEIAFAQSEASPGPDTRCGRRMVATYTLEQRWMAVSKEEDAKQRQPTEARLD